MRLRLLGLLMALLFSVQTQAQQYGLEVEVVSENIGPLVGALGVTDLSGYSCYRAYVTMENEDDFSAPFLATPTIPRTSHPPRECFIKLFWAALR